MGYWLGQVAILVVLGQLGLALYTYRDPHLRKDYDYIIIGAGSAGAVIANRLSEDRYVSVLLLEAGGPPPGLSEVPLLALYQLTGPNDWSYITEPQTTTSFAAPEQRMFWTRNRALGGCSSHNLMMYTRGCHQDFDDWEADGATGWKWDVVKKYFLKSEGMTDKNLMKNGNHNDSGLLTVSSMFYTTPLLDDFMAAGESMGYTVGDYNGDSQLVFSPTQVTQRDGLRCSTEKAFLRPAGGRPNLDILPYSHVTKIEFDDGKTARSVLFDHMNKSYSVSSKKEIILSAGAIGSPHILLLSGVGPKAHLEAHNIHVVSDIPVGQNLQDHIAVIGISYTLNDSVGIVTKRDVNTQTIGQLFDAQGPLTSPASTEGVGFIKTKYADPSVDQPDIQYHLVSSYFIPFWYMKQEYLDSMSPYMEQNAATCFPVLLHPKSRGTIELNTTNPYDHPIIQPNFLAEEDDMLRLIEGVKGCEDLFNQPSLLKYAPVRAPEVLLGCENMDTTSDDYRRCVVRVLGSTIFHPAGTCKMGALKDSATVVDPELRVKGVKGLRVADASVMPLVTSGNTNAPSIMIGEKASDLIRGIMSV